MLFIPILTPTPKDEWFSTLRAFLAHCRKGRLFPENMIFLSPPPFFSKMIFFPPVQCNFSLFNHFPFKSKIYTHDCRWNALPRQWWYGWSCWCHWSRSPTSPYRKKSLFNCGLWIRLIPVGSISMMQQN